MASCAVCEFGPVCECSQGPEKLQGFWVKPPLLKEEMENVSAGRTLVP